MSHKPLAAMIRDGFACSVEDLEKRASFDAAHLACKRSREAWVGFLPEYLEYRDIDPQLQELGWQLLGLLDRAHKAITSSQTLNDPDCIEYAANIERRSRLLRQALSGDLAGLDELLALNWPPRCACGEWMWMIW